MKKLIYCLFLVLFISCIGQNAPVFDNESVIISVIRMDKNKNVYYNEVNKACSYYSFSVGSNYFVTSTTNFMVGDTVVAISKRELRILLNKK